MKSIVMLSALFVLNTGVFASEVRYDIIDVSGIRIGMSKPGFEMITSKVAIDELENRHNDQVCQEFEVTGAECEPYKSHPILKGLATAKKVIDFSKEMAVLVALGERPDNSYSIKIKSVEEKNGVIRVTAEERGRTTDLCPGGAAGLEVVEPAKLVVLPRVRAPKFVLSLEIPLFCE